MDGVGKAKILNGSYVDELDNNDMPTGNTVFDIDDDNASAGWENCNSTFDTEQSAGIVPAMRITVPEDVGDATMNVVIEKGQVGYDFSLVLINVEGSASRHNDYVDAEASGTIPIKAFERTATLSVGIVDNDQLEDTESFPLWLFRNALTDNIAIGCQYLNQSQGGMCIFRVPGIGPKMSQLSSGL